MESDSTRCAVCGQSSEEEITSERERCAKIADAEAERFMFSTHDNALLRNIAAAIRSGR